MHFMIHGEQYKCSYKRFAKILAFPQEDLDKDKLHEFSEPDHDEYYDYMHLPNTPSKDYFNAVTMTPYYRYLNALLRQTLMPKGGSQAQVLSASKFFLSCFYKDGSGIEFSIFDIIWEEINITSWTAKRCCPYAPYIMRMIEVVTKKRFVKNVHHCGFAPAIVDSNNPHCRSSKPKAMPKPSMHTRPSSSRAAAARRPMTYGGGGNPNRGLANMLKKGLSALFGCVKNVHYVVYDQNERLSHCIHQVEENQYRLSQALNLQPPIPPVSPYVPHPPPVYPTNNLFDWANDYFGTSGPPEASYSDVSGSACDYGGGEPFDDDETLAFAQAQLRKGKAKASTSHALDTDDDMDVD
ncbi:unnamed protein product [Urochloa humidicola]